MDEGDLRLGINLSRGLLMSSQCQDRLDFVVVTEFRDSIVPYRQALPVTSDSLLP